MSNFNLYISGYILVVLIHIILHLCNPATCSCIQHSNREHMSSLVIFYFLSTKLEEKNNPSRGTNVSPLKTSSIIK